MLFLANGLLGEAAQDTGKIGRYLAIWNIRSARDFAWDLADSLRPLSGIARDVALATQDQITGVWVAVYYSDLSPQSVVIVLAAQRCVVIDRVARSSIGLFALLSRKATAFGLTFPESEVQIFMGAALNGKVDAF